MIMKSDLLKGQEIDFYYNQISWEKMDDGTVVQTWETFDKEDQIITTVFKGTYIKKDK